MDDNTRYKIADILVEGDIMEVGELANWGDQGGKLRSLVVQVDGVFAPALVPMTVFGDDAVYLDPDRDVGRHARCTGRLTSRRYTDHNGKPRWAMSLTARGLVVSDAGVSSGDDPTGAKALASSMANDPDDIPF